MAYDVTIEGTRRAGKPGIAILTLIAVLTSAIAAFSFLDVSAPADPQTDRAAVAEEDWHGNVRRSTWPN